MSWLDALNEIAQAGYEEFNRPVRVTPMQRVVNGRPQADPARPAYDICGIYDENKGGEGFDKSALQVMSSKSHEKLEIVQQKPSITVRACDLKYPLAQGDQLELTDSSECFRVLAVGRDMAGMTRAEVENIGRMPTA